MNCELNKYLYLKKSSFMVLCKDVGKGKLEFKCNFRKGLMGIKRNKKFWNTTRQLYVPERELQVGGQLLGVRLPIFKATSNPKISLIL